MELIRAPLGALKGRGAEAGPDHPRNYVATFTASKKKKKIPGKPPERCCLDPSWGLSPFSTLMFEATSPSEPWNFPRCPQPGDVQGLELSGTGSKRQVQTSGAGMDGKADLTRGG